MLVILGNGLCLGAFHFTQPGAIIPESRSCLGLVISTGTKSIFCRDFLLFFAVYMEEANGSSAFFIKERTAWGKARVKVCPLGLGRNQEEKPSWYLFWTSFCSGEQLLFQRKHGEKLQLFFQYALTETPITGFRLHWVLLDQCSPKHRNNEHRVTWGSF